MNSLVTRAVRRSSNNSSTFNFASSAHYSTFGGVATRRQAMKVGDAIPGLNLYKEKSAPVALPREEYPEWMSTLATPPSTLAKLRRMPNEEASDVDMMRYLKLSRRVEIKENNAEAGA